MLKKIPCLIWIFVITILLECTVCQYKFWGSLGNESDDNYKVQIDSGGEWNEDGSITVTDGLELEITDIQKKVHSLQFNFRRYSEEGIEVTDGTIVEPYAADEANADYFIMPYKVMFADNPNSQYMRFHLSGECEKIRLGIVAYEGERICVDEVIVNPHIPFDFSLLRCALIFGTIVFLIYANPKKKYYSVLYGEKPVQKLVTITVVIIQLAVFCGAVFLNPAIYRPEYRHHTQYQELAVALSKGQLYLEETPPSFLDAMENPYDFELRERMMEDTGETYIWDCAYFNGKYYVYFGVLPVMIFYLPWYLLMKTAFPTWLGILITGAVFVIATFALSAKIVKKYFNSEIPYVTWLLSTLLVVNGCGVNMIMRRPDFYYLPILMGITLSVIGINFWIGSIKEDGIIAWKLTAGCLCMALVAACRPQLLIGSLLIFPIYWDAVFKKRWLFSRKGLMKTILACFPYVMVGVLLMTYNYRRFGSPFDFGSTYNLTTNDMTRRGMDIARLPSAIFISLFQTPSLSAKFPYLEMTDGWTSYLGKSISEGTYGGFFAVNLMPFVGAFLLKNKQWFVNKKIWAASVMTFVSGLVILCLNAQLAGVLLRYYTDFGWIFYISGVLAWFAAWQYNRGNGDRIHIMKVATNVMFCIGMAYAFLILFVDTGESLSDCNPPLFYEIYYQLAFWA